MVAFVARAWPELVATLPPAARATGSAAWAWRLPFQLWSWGATDRARRSPRWTHGATAIFRRNWLH